MVSDYDVDVKNGDGVPRRTACALVLAAVFAVAGVSPGVAPALAVRSSESVLVNANADGDTPISGGLIHVDRCVRPASRRGVVAGASLRQSNGARSERTNSNGVALLNFDRLPSCFIVSVSGGRTGGRTLGGSFRAEARDQSDQIMSVLVTPVSTLTYAVRRANPGMSAARATRVVQQLLGIPSHYSDIDLDADDRPFDGDRYLSAAARAGGTGKLARALVRTAQRDRRHSFRAPKARGSAAPLGDDPLGLKEWWKDTDVTKLVKDGLKDFGLSLVSEGIQVGGKWVLGRLLDDWGLKDLKDFLLPKPDTQKIIEMIEELTKRVNTLQKTADTILSEVLAGQYADATRPTVPIINAIDTNQQEIANLLKLEQNDPGRVGATKKILASISKLEDQRSLLNTFLTNPIPGVPSILVAASRKAGSQNRWFREGESESVRAVYKYYAIYQLRLANLLVEYWNTRSCTNSPVPQDCLSPTTIQFDLDKFETNIEQQKAQLKPPLPAGTFIDRRTMRMWPQASWPLNGLEALNWTSQWVPKTCRTGTRGATCTGSAVSPYIVPLRTTGLTLPALGPWTDWKYPSEEDYKELIDGWKGDSPLAWLHQQTGFSTTTMTRENDQRRLSGHMWLGNSFRPGLTGLYVYRVNLSEPDTPGPHVWFQHAGMPSAPLACSRDGRTCSEPPSQVDFSGIKNNYTAQMLLWRPVQPGDYWWP
jgi:hypothetical protein